MFRSGKLSWLLSLCLAWLALVLVTFNLLLAAMACACITSVAVIFLGALQLMGWTLGALHTTSVAFLSLFAWAHSGESVNMPKFCSFC
jgi:hypothetical protein